MYLRRCYRQWQGKRHGYWALVESYRTARGPRQRVVAYLGELDAQGRVALEPHADGQARVQQQELYAPGESPEPQWVEVDLTRVRIERTREFGGPWLGVLLLQRLEVLQFLQTALPIDRAEIPWAAMAAILVLGRLCEPSSELRVAEHWYETSALPDLLGVPAAKVNDDRLYRALDHLLPHKDALAQHLKDRLGRLFAVQYDLLLYDVTSTYFEGEAAGNPQAQRGYSRDHRSDCKQINLALVVTREGRPLGYEVFAGNRNDVTTLEEIVETMERRYGVADRIWVLDRGLVSDDHVSWLKAHGRRYILCRSAERRVKERAMHARFEQRIVTGLEAIAKSCQKQAQSPVTIAQRVGRLLGRNSRAAKLFQVEVDADTRGDDLLDHVHHVARLGEPQRRLLSVTQ